MIDQPLAVTPAPQPVESGGATYGQPLQPAPRGDVPTPDPFATAFANKRGESYQVAAGGPFAETLKAIGHETAPLAITAAEEAVQKQSEMLTKFGHLGELPKYAININLDRIDDPAQINGLIDAVASTIAPTVDTARRGTRSMEQTVQAAHELFRQDEGFMLRREVGQAYNAEQITATRLVLASARDKTMNFAQQILAGNTNQENLIGFRRGLSQMAAIQLQLHGAAAEAGRALHAFKHVAQSGILELADRAGALTPAGETPPAGVGTLAPGGDVAGPQGVQLPSSMPAGPGGAPDVLPAPTAAPAAPQPVQGVAPQPSAAPTQPAQSGAASGTPARDPQATADIQAFIDANGGIDNIVDLATRFIDLPSDAERNAVARGSVDRGFPEMLGELWYNFVLSGPATHVVNMTGNAVTLGTETAERALAAKWGKLFGFLGMQEGVKAGEAAAMTQAYWQAIGDAWRLAAFSFRHGEAAGKSTGYRMPMSTLDVLRMTQNDAMNMAGKDMAAAPSKLTAPHPPAITGANVGNAMVNRVNAVSKHILDRNVLDPEALRQRGVLGRHTDFLSNLVDLGGVALRTPTRMLGAEDQFWKTLAYRGEKSARAWREGINAGLSGADLEAYVDQLVNFEMSPSGYDRAAENFAKKVTMQEDLQVGILKHMQMAGASRLGFLFAPFVKVSANMLDYSTARMAFPLRPSWWADLTGRDPALRDMAMARASTGAIMWMTAFAAASTGYDADNDAPVMVTGSGPIEPQKKAIWLQAGNKPYSVRLGGRNGKWIAYSRIDPAGQMLGIAADSVNIMSTLSDEASKSEFAAALVAGIGNNVVNKSYMRSIADGMEVFTSYDPNQWLKWLQGQAAGMAVPNLVTQYVAGQDPYLRKAVGVAEEIAKRSGVESRQGLPLERDLEGNPIKQEWLFGTRYSGVSVGDAKPDAVGEELLRLRAEFHKPPTKIRGVQLDPAQYSRYQLLVGHGLKMPEGSVYYSPAVGPQYDIIELDMSGKGMWEVLTELVKNPTYKLATDGSDPPGQKVDMIQHIRSMYLEKAQARMLAEYPKVFEDVIAAERNVTVAKGSDPDMAEAQSSATRDTLQMGVDMAKDYEVKE